MSSPLLWFGNAAKLLKQTLTFPDATTNSLSISTPSSVTTYSLTLPPAQGAANTILQNDGTGILSWATAPFFAQASVSLYVDINRTDTYTANGTIDKPFLTINAALNQIISNNDGRNYLILIQPGTYTENITLNNAAFTRLAIVASTVADGGLSNDAIPITSLNGNIVSTTNNDNLKALIIRGLDIAGTVNLTGASNGTNFLQYGGVISDCIIYSNGTPAITAVNAGQIIFNSLGSAIASSTGGLTITNVVNFLVYNSFMNLGATTITTNGGGNKPSGFSATNCQFSYGSLGGATSLDASSTMTFRYQRLTSTLSISGTVTSVVSTYLGTVTVGSGGVWNSDGDIVNNTPSNSGTITSTGVLQASGSRLSSLTASSPVLTDASKNLVSGNIALASQVSGILPTANGGTNISSYTTGDTLYASATNVLSKLPIGGTGNVLTVAGGIPSWAAPATSGTVTSVALTVPSILSVSGSPITTSGTLAVTLTNETANTVFAGPTTGGATTPTFRALVTADLPAGTGTVTSVALTVPTFLSVSGSPITTSGTLAVSLSGTALPILNGGTGATTAAAAYNNLSPMTTTGDIEYESGTNTAARLPIGSSGQVLTVSGGLPSWQTSTAATISGQTNHGVVIASATSAMTSTTAGTAGQVLVSNGASADPTFKTCNYQISSSTGTYTTTSTTYADVTNASVTITADGVNPVAIGLMGDGTLSGSSIGMSRSAASMDGLLKLVKNGSDFVVFSLDYGANINDGPSRFFYIDPVPAAGSVTYKFQAKVVNGSLSETLLVTNCKLFAYVMR